MTAEKRKPGRPRSAFRQSADFLQHCMHTEGTQRTKENVAHWVKVQGMITDQDESTQRCIMGYTEAEVIAGCTRLPVGFKSACIEINRYRMDCGNDAAIIDVLLDARKRGFSWRDIGFHFRRLRLGERSGDTVTLSNAVIRAINEYLKVHPDTSTQVISEALSIVGSKLT